MPDGLICLDYLQLSTGLEPNATIAMLSAYHIAACLTSRVLLRQTHLVDAGESCLLGVVTSGINVAQDAGSSTPPRVDVF